LSVRRLVQQAAKAETPMFVPAVVVAETIRGRGPRDAPVERLLAKADEVLAADEAVARSAGALLAASQSSATIDAIVVAHAVRIGQSLILTSDPRDMHMLLPRGASVQIQAI
jgi:predicted nucleic acid-binding protein